MKLNYVASASLASITFPLMGGGMGNGDLSDPLKPMAMPSEIDDALDQCRVAIVKEVRKALKQGRTLLNIEYNCEIVDNVDGGGVLAEGAYIQVTATAEYE